MDGTNDEGVPSEPQPAPVEDATASNEADAAIVARIRAGEYRAFEQLYDRWFDHVLDLAYHVLWDENAAADVARDAFRAAWNDLGNLVDPSRYGPWVLGIARITAIERQQGAWRARPAGSPEVPPEDKLLGLTDPSELARDEFCANVMWDAAESLGARDHDVLDLDVRHGLDANGISEALVLPVAVVAQAGPRARQRLDWVRQARVLWRDGEPKCATLRAELIAADVEAFDGETVFLIDSHATQCSRCTAASQFELSAVDMFAALPLLTSPALKTRVASELAKHGVGARPPAGGASAPAGRERRTWAWAGAVVLAGLTLLVILGAAALSSHNSPVTVAAPPDSTTTSTPSSSTTASTTTSTSTSSTSTSTSTSTTTVTTSTTIATAPIAAPITTVPPPVTRGATTTTTTTVPSQAVSFTLSPTSEPTGYSIATGPLLSWNVTGAKTVFVSDSAGVFGSSAATGSAQVCPASGAAATCPAVPGTYTYVLDAYDATGAHFAHRTVTLTITV